MTPFCLRTSRHLGNIGKAWGNLLTEGGEHSGGHAALACEFEHLSAARAVAKAVHGTGGYMHQRARQAHDRLVVITEFDLPFQDIEGLVPVGDYAGVDPFLHRPAGG